MTQPAPAPRTAVGRPRASHGLPSPDGRFLWDDRDGHWEPKQSWPRTAAGQPLPNCQLDPDGFCVIHGSEWHDGYTAAQPSGALREVLEQVLARYERHVPYAVQALHREVLDKARAALAATQPAEGLDVERLENVIRDAMIVESERLRKAQVEVHNRFQVLARLLREGGGG